MRGCVHATWRDGVVWPNFWKQSPSFSSSFQSKLLLGSGRHCQWHSFSAVATSFLWDRFAAVRGCQCRKRPSAGSIRGKYKDPVHLGRSINPALPHHTRLGCVKVYPCISTYLLHRLIYACSGHVQFSRSWLWFSSVEQLWRSKLLSPFRRKRYLRFNVAINSSNKTWTSICFKTKMMPLYL